VLPSALISLSEVLLGESGLSSFKGSETPLIGTEIKIPFLRVNSVPNPAFKTNGSKVKNLKSPSV